MAKKSGQTIINGMPHSDEDLEEFRGRVARYLSDAVKRIPTRGAGASTRSDGERLRDSVEEKLDGE